MQVSGARRILPSHRVVIIRFCRLDAGQVRVSGRSGERCSLQHDMCRVCSGWYLAHHQPRYCAMTGHASALPCFTDPSIDDGIEDMQECFLSDRYLRVCRVVDSAPTAREL